MLYRAFIFILTTIVSLCCLPVAHARQDSEHNHAPMNEPFRGGEGVGETSGLNSDTADFKRGQSLSNSAVSVNELLGVDLEAEKQNMVKIKAAGQGESAVSANSADADSLTMTTMSITSDGGALPLPEKMIKNFQFDPYSGSGNVSIPIYTPTGRAGVQPQVALTYSHRGSNDVLGVGWSINFGAIERSTKNGVPDYDGTDTFICTLGGGSFELVNIGGNEYRARVEGAFMKFIFSDPYWEAKDKQGNTYYFGLDTLLEDDSRLEDDNKVYRWYLSEVKDVHGNYYFVRNFEDGGFEILYTGEPGTDRDALRAGTQNFAHKITGTVEGTDRDDIGMNSKSGIAIWQRRRLASIEVRSNDILQRKYVLGYGYSPRTGRSLLKSITEYGSDGVTAMPALTFEYQEDSSPVYDLQTAFGDIESGDNRFNIRFNEAYEIGHENIYTLYPIYNGDPDFGFFNSGHIIPWGPKHTDHVYNSGGIYWYQDIPYGNLDFSGPVDSAMKAWTYLFLRDQAGLVYFNFAQSDVAALYINGTYGNVLGPGTYTLNQGYNLIEFTAYNQNDIARLKLMSHISTQVDVMNSTQLVLPQLSGDFNGDGLADLATFSSVDGKVLVALSQGEAFLPKTEWISNFGVDSQLFLGDFNGDGKVDLGAYNPDTDNVHVALSTGSAFSDAGIWQNRGSIYPIVSSGDINGDGLSDLIMFFYNVHSYYYQVYYSNGTSFDAWNYNDQYAGALNDNLFTGDFNGDGLSDFARFTRSTGNWEIRYNLTDSSGIPQTLLTTVSGFGQNRNFTVSDFNDDGLLDIGYYEHLTGNIIYRPSKGTSFSSTDHSLPFVFSIYDETAQVQSSDYNGDGLTDFILYTELANEQYAYSTQGKHADLLAKSKNGLGGETSFVYGSAVHYDNSYLPFNFPVITSVSVSNCLGDEYTTAYSYGQGLWEAGEREFYGFGYTKVTDEEGNFAESYFRQDNVYMRGRPDRQEQYDAAGNLYSKSTNTWETEDIYPSTTPPVKFVKLSRSDNYVYDGDSEGKRTAQEFYYEESPQLGNMTKTAQWGEVDIDTGADTGVDSRTVETLYLNNTNGTNWLIGLPYDITIKDHDNETVRRSWMYYDYHSGLTDVPVKGLLTKEEKWGGTIGNPETEFTYDMYGNLLTTTDPMENVTSIIYDTDYHVFPLRTENALGQQVVNEYYGINGEALNDETYSGLWGQLKSTTDPNSQTGSRDYDVFGRLVASVGPLDSITYPSVVQEYTLGNPYSFIKTRQRINHGQAATLDAVEAYDGLGRLVQTKKASATTGQYIVSGQTEYNSRGLPEKQYIPKFTNLGFNEIDTIDPQTPHTTSEYDAMGRLVTSTNPDGTYASVMYDDWTVTGTDENGHMQKSCFDAYGRLVKKEEYMGADGRSPDYSQAGYSLYATTRYAYDSEGNLIEMRDHFNNTTTIEYDELGRKVSMDDPDMGYWQYGYDLNGNLEWQTDAKGQTINFDYDELNRLTNKNDSLSLSVSYMYDDPLSVNSVGRLYKSFYDFDAQTRFFYDALGRETQSRKVIDGQEYAVGRDYDALSRLTSVTYPEGMEVFYTYDAAGQIKTVSVNTSGNQIPDPPQVPEAPVLTAATSGNTQVALTWSSVSGADGYKVKYGTSSGSYDTTVDAGDVTSYVIQNLTNGVTYYFAVAACNVNGDSGLSNEMDAVPSLPPVAISFDAASSAQADDVSSLTFSHTVAGEDNRVLIVAFSLRNYGSSDLTPGVSSVTYGGQALTRIAQKSHTTSSYKMTSELWYVLAPASGTNTIQANFGRIVEGITAGSVSLYGVKQQAPEAIASASNYSKYAGTSLTTLTDGAWVIDSLAEHYSSSTVTADAGQAEFYRRANSGDNFGAGSYKEVPGAATTSMGWTFNIRRYWAEVSAAFAPADGPTAWLNDPREEKALEVVQGGADIKSLLSKAKTAVQELGRMVVEYFLGAPAYADTVPQAFDLTTFTENDPTSQVTTTADCAAYTNIETRSTNAYVYAEHATSGDFEYEFDGIMTTADTFAGEVLLWGLSNDGGETYDDWGDGLYLGFYKSGSTLYARLFKGTTYDSYSGLSMNQRYYFRVARSGRTVSAKIYADSARTQLLDTLTRTDSNDYEYLYAFSTESGTSTTKKATGDMCHMVQMVEQQGGGLAAPVLNSATPGNGQVSLAWSQVAEAAGYKIKYGTSSGTYTTTLDVGNVTSYQVGGLQNGETYYFVVVAYNATEESVPSNELSAAPALPQTIELITDIQYNAMGQITQITYGNGTVKEYAYDPVMSRLMNMKVTNGYSVVIQDLSYTYDSVGNIKSITDNVHSADQTFEYDALNRLVEAVGETYGTKTYAYNEIGNIMQKDGIYYAYGENGAGPHAVTSLSDGSTFAYDNNGNMVGRVESGITTEYIYDAENRLIEVNKNGANVADYEYDGDGGRTKKIVYGTLTSTTRFVGSLFENKDGEDRSYIYLGDQRIAGILGGTLAYYFNDHLGGINVVADADGVKQELAEYNPFGTFARQEQFGAMTDTTERYYTGQHLDDETGLYYYNARYYDPKLGRFTQADTIVQAPNNPQTLNRYTYCNNNPVNRIDPSGHGFKKWFKKVFEKFGIGTPVIGHLITPLFPLINGFNLLISSSIYTENWKPAKEVAIFSVSTLIGMGVTSFAASGFSSLGLGDTMATILGSTAGGAAGGASSAAMLGGDIGEAAWQGAAIAGTLSVLAEANRFMREKMIEQSKKNPLNIGAKSGGGPSRDKTKIAGTRALRGATKLENCGPLGGCQGGQGEFFDIPYKPDSILDYVHESFAGPHDYFSSLLYDAQGNGKVFNNIFMRGASFLYSVGALPVAAPFAAAPIITQNGLTPVASIYGISNWSDENQYNPRDDD